MMWPYVLVGGLVVLIGLSFLARPMFATDDDDAAQSWSALLVGLTIITGLAGLLGYLTLTLFTPELPTWLWLTLAIATFIVMIAWLLLGINQLEIHAFPLLTIMMLFMGLSVVNFIKVADDNPYQINSGTVIRQEYSAGDDDSPEVWAIELRNCTKYPQCEDGWIHFSSDVFNDYPVGSQYPGAN